jgi:hypothetical protein
VDWQPGALIEGDLFFTLETSWSQRPQANRPIVSRRRHDFAFGMNGDGVDSTLVAEGQGGGRVEELIAVVTLYQAIVTSDQDHLFDRRGLKAAELIDRAFVDRHKIPRGGVELKDGAIGNDPEGLAVVSEGERPGIGISKAVDEARFGAERMPHSQPRHSSCRDESAIGRKPNAADRTDR